MENQSDKLPRAMSFMKSSAGESLRWSGAYAASGNGGRIVTALDYALSYVCSRGNTKIESHWLSLASFLYMDNRGDSPRFLCLHGTDLFYDPAAADEHYNQDHAWPSSIDHALPVTIMPDQDAWRHSQVMPKEFAEADWWDMDEQSLRDNPLFRQIFGGAFDPLVDQLQTNHDTRPRVQVQQHPNTLLFMDNPFRSAMRHERKGVFGGFLVIDDLHARGRGEMSLGLHGSNFLNRFNFAGVRDGREVNRLVTHVDQADIDERRAKHLSQGQKIESDQARLNQILKAMAGV